MSEGNSMTFHRVICCVGLLLSSNVMAQFLPRPDASGGFAGDYGISVVATLGACNAGNAGQAAWVSPDASLYVCNGTAWEIVWLESQGYVSGPTYSGDWYTLTVQAPSTSTGIDITAGSKIDFGGGSNDYCQGASGRVYCPSLTAADLLVDNVSNRNASLPLRLAVSTGVVFNPYASLPVLCDGTVAGKVAALSSDGRLYECDGTAFRRMARVIPVTASVTVPSLSAFQEGTVTTTVTGAATGEHVTANMLCDIPFISIRRVRVSAANTVSIVFGNADGVGTNPASPTACDVAVEVSK